jgi:putative ABC transport system permease protein
VSRRTREIGIRMALGAHKSDVLRLVLAQGMRPAAIGGASGLCFSLILSRLLAAFVAIPDTIDLLFGANPMDPVTFIGAPVFPALVAMTAAIVPARRAMRVDPVTALRYE